MYPESILPVVMHIPHAGTQVPSAVAGQFTVGEVELWREILTVTDWCTHDLYGIPGVATTCSPVSRVVTDVERYTDDALEPKSAVGQGAVYTHDTQGNPIRRSLLMAEYGQLLSDYYYPWHFKLALDIRQQLDRWGHCLLLDCHSFPDQPFANEAYEARPRPDICLGISDDNTPRWLVDEFTRRFESRGYSVAIDFPYAGCLVPDMYVGNRKLVAIMIEINRRLYLEDIDPRTAEPGVAPTRSANYSALRGDLWSVILEMVKVQTCHLG